MNQQVNEQINNILTNNKSVYVTNEIKSFQMFGYDTLIMCTDQDDKYRKGYVNLTKFVSDFQSKNPNESVKVIRNWAITKDAKEEISRCTNSCSGKYSLTIMGGSNKDIQGTYFHPELVLTILMWANSKLKDQMEQIIWNSINKENSLNRQVDDLEAEFQRHVDSKTLTIHTITSLLKQLNEIEPQLTENSTYAIKCLRLINKIRDSKDSLTEEVHGIQLQQATMIHGHIYERSIDYDTIKYLCESRLNEIDIQQREEGSKKVQRALNKIKTISELFKYIGQTKQFNINENSNDPREVNHDKKIKEAIEMIMNIPDLKREPKYIIFAALSIVINELIPTFVGKVQTEDMFNTVKVEDNIVNQDILNEREKYHIRMRKPLINAVKYNKSLKTNAELKNKYTIEIQEHQARIDKLQQEITTLKRFNSPDLIDQIKEKESLQNKYIVTQNKAKSKRNAIPEEEYIDLKSTITIIDTESVTLNELPTEITNPDNNDSNHNQTQEPVQQEQQQQSQQEQQQEQPKASSGKFVCDKCGKSLSSKQSLQKHQINPKACRQ